MSILLNEYDLGGKTALDTQIGKKGIQMKITQQNEQDVKNSVLKCRVE